MDIRPRIIVGAAGQGRHIVKARDGGLPYVVQGPLQTYRPGTMQPTGSHSDIDRREFLLANTSRPGASESSSRTLAGRTPAPPAVVETEVGGIYAIYYDGIEGGETDVARCVLLDTAGVVVETIGSDLTLPGSQASSRPSPRIGAVIDRPQVSGVGRGSYALVNGGTIHVLDFENDETRTYTPGGGWAVGGAFASFGWITQDGGYLVFLERNTSSGEVRARRWGGGSDTPTTLGTISVSGGTTGLTLHSARIVDAGIEAQAYKGTEGAPSSIHDLFFGPETETTPGALNGARQVGVGGDDTVYLTADETGDAYVMADTVDGLSVSGPGSDHWPTTGTWGSKTSSEVVDNNALIRTIAGDKLAVFWPRFSGAAILGVKVIVSPALEPGDGWEEDPEIQLATAPSVFGSLPFMMALREEV